MDSPGRELADMDSPGRVFLAFKRGLRWIEGLMGGVGSLALTVIMFLGTADVMGRYFFNSPITGTQEICLTLMGIALFLSWPITQAKRANIGLDILYQAYPPRVQAALDTFMLLLTLVLMGLIGWAGSLIAMKDTKSGLEIDTIGFPAGPLKFLIPFGGAIFILECIVLIRHRLIDLKTGKEESAT